MNRWARTPSLLVVLFAGLCVGARAQSPPQAEMPPQGYAQQPQDPQPQNPQLQPNPLEALRNLEPPINEEYRLGRGDEITVDFAGRPDLQAKLVVGPDGRITLPLAGDILLDGLTRTEATKAIAAALSS